MSSFSTIFILLLAIYVEVAHSKFPNENLNGPPMIWESWGAFGCQVDCIHHPTNCLQQNVIQQVFDKLVKEKYVDAGYNYVHIDDCWQASVRNTSNDRLIPDRFRFQNLSELINNAKSKNIKMGIYECLHEKCNNNSPGTFSGQQDHTAIDAKTFVEWGFEMVKIWGPKQSIMNYENYRQALDSVAGKGKILFYCNIDDKIEDEREIIKLEQICNIWNIGDPTGEGSDDPVSTIWTNIKDFAKNVEKYRLYHRTGSWILPQPLLIGNSMLAKRHAQTQMAFWCLWSVPLIISADIRNLEPDNQEILLNKNLIEINQDPLHDMGIITYNRYSEQVWVKKLEDPDSFAILYFNNRTEPGSSPMKFPLSSILSANHLKFDDSKHYKVEDLFHDPPKELYSELPGTEILDLQVHNQGSVRLVKLTSNY